MVVIVTLTAARLSITLSSYVRRRPLLFGVVEVLVVRDSFAIVERLVAVLVDGTEMHKNIFASVVGGDEAEPLVTEELDFSRACHDEEMDEVVARTGTKAELKAMAVEKGFKSMKDDGILKVLEGITTLDALSKVVDIHK